MTALEGYVSADYYRTSLRTGREYISEPYYENVGGGLFQVKPVEVCGGDVGAVALGECF